MLYLQWVGAVVCGNWVVMREVVDPPIFKTHPGLQPQWVPLIPQATPVSRLAKFGQDVGHSHLYVKREDLTAPGYGGNKVRNLEFLLGRAQALGCKRVAMVAPLGSNFVAAAASQATRIGMKSEFFHFVPTRNKQINRHARFTQSVGASLHTMDGAILPAILKSSLGLSLRMGQNFLSSDKTFRLPIGGSDVLGVLGHVNAALELAMQIRRGEIPPIDQLVLGVGTCGTMAGLLVGLRLAGLNTKVIGVRCVDRIICNEYKIAALANQVTKKLRLNFKFRASEIDLRNYCTYDELESVASVHYARPLPHADALISQMFNLEGLTLDTTYTTKVIHFLKNWIQKDAFQTHKKNILYWHTFSPTAMNFAEDLQVGSLQYPLRVRSPIAGRFCATLRWE